MEYFSDNDSIESDSDAAVEDRQNLTSNTVLHDNSNTNTAQSETTDASDTDTAEEEVADSTRIANSDEGTTM